MKNLARFGLLALVSFLAACGGGDPEPDGTKAAAAAPTGSLLVVGNSITRHPPADWLKWTGDWGLAASEQSKDFAHMTGAGLQLPVTAINAARNESDPQAPLPVLTVDSRTVVVVALGDNGMPARYAEILALTKGAKMLLCTSTWWKSPAVDEKIEAACKAAGGRFVFIGDIFKGRLGLYAHEGVDLHPGDEGMAEIARRIVAAAKV